MTAFIGIFFANSVAQNMATTGAFEVRRFKAATAAVAQGDWHGGYVVRFSVAAGLLRAALCVSSGTGGLILTNLV